MTDQTTLSRLRDLVAALPGSGERESDGQPTFIVGDEPFARVRGAAVEVRTPDGAGWDTLDAGDDADWQLIEDRVSHSWELTAPTGLLEAGGR